MYIFGVFQFRILVKTNLLTLEESYTVFTYTRTYLYAVWGTYVKACIVMVHNLNS